MEREAVFTKDFLLLRTSNTPHAISESPCPTGAAGGCILNCRLLGEGLMICGWNFFPPVESVIGSKPIAHLTLSLAICIEQCNNVKKADFL